jgi:hypothetical protein
VIPDSTRTFDFCATLEELATATASTTKSSFSCIGFLKRSLSPQLESRGRKRLREEAEADSTNTPPPTPPGGRPFSEKANIRMSSDGEDYDDLVYESGEDDFGQDDGSIGK